MDINERKFLSSSKNIILVGLLIWIGLILGNINENLSPQRRFKNAQLMCANYITQYANNREDKYVEDLAKFTGMPNKKEYLVNYCNQIQILSGKSRG